MSWQPPARAPWVEKLVAFGQGLGDDGRSMISLQTDDLIAAAQAASGLEDVGDDWFREPLERLCTALDEEAGLHLPGRMRTRAELQLLMENRLRLVDLWTREPGIADEQVVAPIIVTGLGRSGTTLLHELLDCDPANRAPKFWELVDTVPVPTADEARDPDTPRARRADAEITVMDEMVPAFTSMHENRGHLPTECIFLFAHQFSSDQFTGLYNVPSYTIWRSGVDQTPIYDWHRHMLQTLQWGVPTERFVVKAPSHLGSLPLVFAAYPDARVVMLHRDPLRVVGSLADLMATLHWMHSDHADYDLLVQFLTMGVELQMDAVTAERDAGTLPAADQITDVRYTDLVADPVAVVERLYTAWDLEITPDFRAALDAYVAARHTHRAGGPGVAHDYRFEDTGLDLAEHRALVAAYQARFDVTSEV
jgi:hypothetical protein